MLMSVNNWKNKKKSVPQLEEQGNRVFISLNFFNYGNNKYNSNNQISRA
jgi:hypothetical protein